MKHIANIYSGLLVPLLASDHLMDFYSSKSSKAHRQVLV